MLDAIAYMSTVAELAKPAAAKFELSYQKIATIVFFFTAKTDIIYFLIN